MAFWFRQKYNLPPLDPRFLDMTPEDIEAEYWACERAASGAKVEDEDEDFDKDSILAEIEAEAEAAGGAADEFEDVINERH
jgi:hypothetical protein